jgi:hypothetical protein
VFWKGDSPCKKAFLFVIALVAAIGVSGCAAVGRYSMEVDGGTRTTCGLISFDAVSDGYR